MAAARKAYTPPTLTRLTYEEGLARMRKKTSLNEPTVLHWRPCPFYCPDEPLYFRKWTELAEAMTQHKGTVTVDMPPARPFPRGTHDNTGLDLRVTATGVQITGAAGARCSTPPQASKKEM
jgi:hypothetical protein